MAEPSTLRRATRIAARAVTLPISLIGYAATEPLLPGALLIALTRAPLQYRSRFLQLLSRAGLSPERITRLIKTLKFLLALGVARRVNEALNRLALNHWQLFGKPGAPFNWNAAKKPELIVVTGGCSGFGYEMVKGFSKHARVIILDISPVPEELKQLSGVYYYQLDLTDFAAIEATAETIRREHGDPSVLINNAGIATGTTILDTNSKLNDRIFKVNIACHLVLIKEFLPGMLKAKKGHVVTIASMASFYAAPGLVDYCCTKIGALYLTEGLRNELRNFHANGTCIQTTSVHPSWHATGIIKPYEDRLAKMGVHVDPASNVSDAIVEQVLAGRSGRIFMPRSESRNAGARNFPVWLQDVVMYATAPVTAFRD